MSQSKGFFKVVLDLLKTKGQIFSPPAIVEQMLDLCSFNDANILKQKVIDNSCGDGAFLKIIVERIIKIATDLNYAKIAISKILENNIYGIEIDQNAFKNCYQNLESIRLNYQLPEIKWKLFNDNTLRIYANFVNQFDLVIGNPPYVRIHHTNEDLKQFQFCQTGMSDLYIAFYEIGLKMLKPSGKLCYINPSSLFHSQAARFLRQYIIKQSLLNTVIDFGHKQLFNKITTYVAIVLLDFTKEQKVHFVNQDQASYYLDYHDVVINHAWYFQNHLQLKRILNCQPKMVVKNGVATLCDWFFINDFFQTIQSPYLVEITKASTLKNVKIFFPYDQDFKLIAFKDFPLKIQKFLLAHQKQLSKRSLSDVRYWWSYGRTQAIRDLNHIKLSVNTLINDNIKSIKTKVITKGLVYSGLYVVVNSIKQAKEIETLICSQIFIDYVKTLGKYKSGGYWTFNSQDLNKFISFYLEQSSIKKIKT